MALLVASFINVSPAMAAPSSSVYGQWMTDDGAGIIEIKPCGSFVCGNLVKVLNPDAPERDINNPDPKRRKQTLVGTRILSGLSPKGDSWEDGKVYDPKAGRSYKASISLASPSRLDVTGCLLFVCRTKHWTRVSGKAG